MQLDLFKRGTKLLSEDLVVCFESENAGGADFFAPKPYGSTDVYDPLLWRCWFSLREK